MAGVDRPDEWLVERVELVVVRDEDLDRRVLAEVPEIGYGRSSMIWRGSGQ